MDQELKLILKLEGMEKLKALAGFTGDVTKAIGDRQRAGKELEKSIKQIATAEQILHGEMDKHIAILRNVKNVSTQVSDSMASDHGRMMKSYFKTGEEMRRFFQEQRLGNRIFSESTQAVNSFTSILGGTEISRAFSSLANNFQTLEFTIQSTAIAATGAGGKMAAFGNILASIALPVTALAAGVLYVVNHFKELTKASDEASKSLGKTFTDSMQEYFNLNPKQMLEYLEGQRPKLLEDVRVATEGLLRAQAFTASSSAEKILKEDIILRYNAALKKANEEVLKLEVRIKRAQKEAGLGPATAAPLPEDVELIPPDFWDTHEYTPGEAVIKGRISPLTMSELSGRGDVGRLGGLGTGLTGARGRVPGMLQGVAPKPSSWGESKEVKMKFEELSTETRGLFTSMSAMADAASTHISDSLTNGLREAFGEGKNLFEDMLLAFMTSLADFGIKELFKGVLSFLPGGGILSAAMANGGVITEPMLAKGMYTGRLVAMGERGPELVTPLNKATGIHHASMNTETQSLIASVNMLARTIAGGAWKVRGTQLAYLQDKVSRIHAGMKM